MKTEKVALVTGANQGIGFTTAELLLKKGVTVVLTARDETKGKEALEKLSSYKNCFFHQLNVNDEKSIERAKEFVEKKFEKLDILINNAAINYDTWHDVLNADLEEVIQTLDTNILGAWRVSQAFIPLMIKNNYGRVVNISSGAGNLDSQTGGTPAYSLSKLALNALTIQFANRVKGNNILVNSICPGWVRTSMGGMGAPRSAESAAEGIVWAAMIEDTTLTGKFFRDGKIIDY